MSAGDPGLGLVTHGLVDPTSLGLTSRGLLLEATAVLEELRAPGEGPTADVRLVFDTKALAADVRVAAGQLEPEHGLLTSIVVSLFTDRLAREDDPLPAGETSRRGWWGDFLPVVDGDLIGSRLWLLSREKTLESVRVRAIEYAREALAWLTEDAVAESVEVEAEIQKLPGGVVPSVLALLVRVVKPQEREIAFRFRYVWRNT